VSDLKDFHFDAPKGPGDFETGPVPPPTSPEGGKGRLVAILLIVGIAVVLIGILLSRWLVSDAPEPVAEETSPPASTATQPAPTEPESETPPLVLPELDASDELARQLISALSAHPNLAAWLASDELIRSFTAAIVNISEGTTPKPHLGIITPAEPFSVGRGPGGRYPSAKSYSRYDALTEVFRSLDTAGTVELYRQLEPLIDSAFVELGYPGESFRRVLIGALDHLLATPNVEADVALTETVSAYRYADADLEALSAAQKQLLRTGPDNVRKIQRKISELRRELISNRASTQ
jgi:hypothetical protein